MLVIAHRAGTDRYQEQSIYAARNSLAHCASYVEMDVRINADGIPVICHDENALRIYGVDRNIHDMSTCEFMTLRNRNDIACATYTLQMALAAQLVPALLHIKTDDMDDLNAILNVIGNSNQAENIVMGVGVPEAVEKIKAFDTRIGVLAFMHREADMDAFLTSECDVIRLWEPWITRNKIELIHKCGKLVWCMSGVPGDAHTVSTVGYTDMANLAKWDDMGIDGVLINEVEKAFSALGREEVAE